MKFQLSYTKAFDADINIIFDYIANDNLTKAIEFTSQIEVKIKNLLEQPYIGKINNEDSRRLVHNNYLIYYSVNDSEGIIYIERIVHGARTKI